jgi:predicted NBD/HSP70 family sugar kinase/mannose-6-phosphate isomerase class I
VTEGVNRYVVGVDVGGTHVTAAVVDSGRERVSDASRVRLDVDSGAAAHAILCAWVDAIGRSIAAAGVGEVGGGIGFAMPGPFDYPRGISLMRGHGGKFASLFGVNVRQFIAGALGIEPGLVTFRNDAACFALGEAWLGAGRGASRVVGVTLGTGLGSAFVRDGAAVTRGAEVPPDGQLWCVPLGGQIAEEQFSARGLLRRYEQTTGRKLSDVAQLAERAHQDAVARATFDQWGEALGRFLRPFLEHFGAQRLVVGGSIAKSWSLFRDALAGACAGVDVRQASRFEDAALIGAASPGATAARDESRLIRARTWRRSRQKLMPLMKPSVAAGRYDLYPTTDIGAGKVHAGIDALADAIGSSKRVVIDGYVGVFFDDLRARLDASLRARGASPIWYEARAALRPGSEITGLVAPFLGGDDPLFGTRFTGTMDDFFDAGALAAIKPDGAATCCIIIGPGAALANWGGLLVYADLPKNELQFRSRAGSVTNLGADDPAAPKEMYKRFYFVDWPALNEHKRRVLPRVDLIADAQRSDEPALMRGGDFRAALATLSSNAFRVRPWFEPGPWGGQWMKENFPDLPPDEPNYAWSFELIVPENGLIFESGGKMIEVSFDWLMCAAHEQIIGESSPFFGHEFPIRFDYLDTVRGGNLSVQCHPRPEYIRANFGERFTQDETYYIHHADGDARVYLGFKDNVDSDEFRAALDRSASEGVPVDIDRYVASWPVNKHDLLLIPNGTIHCSGVGNLVLEISATPYIFTFKMYDWMRTDLDGRPRSLNVGRAFENLYFDRRGERIPREFISKPREVARGDGCRIVHLPTHEEHFYDVRRYEFARRIEVKTERSCHVGNLVEGSQITVRTKDLSLRVAYGETFVVPAAAGEYELVNEAGGEAKVVVAFVKGRDRWHGFSTRVQSAPDTG